MSRRTTTTAGAGGGGAPRDAVLSFVGGQATVGTSGMTFPQGLPERSWERIGSGLRELTNSSAWWLGDWLVYGETTYGARRYREAVERTGLDYQTLRNYAWVARRFEHHRRRDSLSFAHHAEVTSLPPAEQDHWLREADRLKWSRNELRRALRAGAAPADGDPHRRASRTGAPGATVEPHGEVATLTIELSAGQLDHYSQAAAAHGLPVEQWVTRMLDAVDRRTA
ncbi:LmbU family transcriptional regulator [Streptomyces galbus]|uniref:LmbU family transcriptional regulator n=1 Tax=Streptomyces galbus TaxID=33898 RepID=A0ABX1IJT7_STRGB|nr:LmbU family transcriptional regulator [Streptomyces galbus]NKQ25888.1 LmbU family transcriptional regulator [Streptomyces galbus]